MTQYQTPYGTIEAPSLEAAQKWMANQKGVAGAKSAPQTSQSFDVPGDTQRGFLGRLWQGVSGRDSSKAGAVGMGMADPVYGMAQIGARMPMTPPDQPGMQIDMPAGTKETVDKAVADREQRYETGRGEENRLGYDWMRLLGNIASPANAIPAMIPGGGGMGLGARLAMGGMRGAASGAMQPVPGAAAGGNFGREKLLQAGVGAMVGAPLEGAFGGRAAASPETAQRAADMMAQGLKPNVPTVGQSRLATGLGKVGSAIPLSPVSRGMDANVKTTEQAAERYATQMGHAESAPEAANIVRNELRGFAADKSEAEKNYGDFFRLMHGAPPIAMQGTLKFLNDLMGRFPSAPELKGLLTNAKLRGIADALEPKTVTTPGQVSKMMDAYGNPMWVRPSTTKKTGGTLTIPEVKELRTQLGSMLEEAAPGPDSIPQAQLKRLYGMLTNDLKVAAKQRSMPALKALEHATQSYGLRSNIRERIAPLLSSNTSAEHIFGMIANAARGGSGGNPQFLQTAKAVMSPQAWNNVGAVMLRQMGQKTGKDAGDFALDTYATNWNKMSGPAKDLLFGPNAPGSPRAGMEQLARVVNMQRQTGLVGPMGARQAAAAAGIVGYVLHSVMSGHIPLKELGGLGGAWGASKLLMSPGFTKWLYRVPNIAATAPDQQTAIQRAASFLRSDLISGMAAGAAPTPDMYYRAPASFSPDARPLH